MAEPVSKRRRTTSDAQSGAPIADSRFANIQSDPRYRLPGKKQKIKLDKRFARQLQEESEVRRAKVDRYGRSLKSSLEGQKLKRKFEFEESENEDSDDPDDDDEVLQELQRVDQARDLLREGRNDSSSEDDSSSDEDSDLEADNEDQAGPGVRQNDVIMGEVSARLAVVNLDWDNIRAEDLYAVFTSFLPATGRLLKVTVYPSEFGKERMEREELEGPPKEIFAASNPKDAQDGDDISSEDDVDIKASIVQPDDGSEFDSTALRQYQLDRLRYFYAVLEFSSKDTAKSIYDTVDGAEYLSTANFFDLRFVPDETDFSEDRVRDECAKIPPSYKPNEFVTDALQHSKVKLTWDAEDNSRKEAQARAFRGGRNEIDQNDLQAYLGSDSDSDDNIVEVDAVDTSQGHDKVSRKETERQRMRALLGLAPEPEKKSKTDKNGPVGNVQITFSSGLVSGTTGSDAESNQVKSAGQKRSVFENSPEPEETTLEKYARKEKERRQRRKEKMKPNKTDEPEQEDKDLGFDDPFFAEGMNDKSTSNKVRRGERLKKKHEREAEELANDKQRAELELLLADDPIPGNGSARNNAADVGSTESRPETSRKSKKKDKNRSRNGPADATNEDNIIIDPNESRFASLFENHEYAVDPTHPRFKATNGMKALMDEGRRRKSRKNETIRSNVEEPGQKLNRSKKQHQSTVEADTESVLTLVEKIKQRR